MKKLILLILVLCTLTSCAKKNEEFEIRNGIKFGMSKEEVIAIEGEPDSKEEYKSVNEFSYDNDFIKGLSVDFSVHFDGQDKVKSMVYWFPPCKDDDYKVIDDDLVKKYGAPLSDNTWEDYYTDSSSPTKSHERKWYICQNEDELITISHLKNSFLKSERELLHLVIYSYENASYKEAIEKAKQDKL